MGEKRSTFKRVDTKKPVISVLMPSLNVEPYIRACLKSVVEQTLRDIEIICIDAGSTDGTLEIIREFADRDRRIKVILSDKKSYGRQMNLGLDACRGRYVAIVETDDLVPLEMFQDLVKCANRVSADLVKADFYRFTENPDGTLNKTLNRLTSDRSLYNRVVNPTEERQVFRLIMNTWSGIYRASFLRMHDIRHNETPGASFQDNGFWFQTFMWAKRAYFVDRPYYLNRRDRAESSVFNTSKMWAMRDEYDFVRKVIDCHAETLGTFVPLCNYYRFCGYFYNTLWRISPDKRTDFLEFFSSQFRQLCNMCEIDRALFTGQEWQSLEMIMFSPARMALFDQSNEMPKFCPVEKLGREGEPVASIIVPVYNVEKYLRDCLDSLLAQTCADIEVICVNDGSTDGSAAILTEYADKDRRVRIFGQVNAGLSAARNAGLEKVSGRYVFFVDSDDGLQKDTIERVVAEAEKNKSDIVVFGFQTDHYPLYGKVPAWLDSKNPIRNIVYPTFVSDVLFKEPGGMPLACRNCYRRAFLERIGARFVPDLRFGEDTIFQMQVFPFAKNITFLPDRFYYYRCTRPGSLMNVNNGEILQKTRNHVRIVSEALNVLNSNGRLDKLRQPFITWGVNFVLGEYERLNDHESRLVAVDVEAVIQRLIGEDRNRWLGPGNRKRLAAVEAVARRERELRSTEGEGFFSFGPHPDCERPVISVIVPAHNAEATIRRCISSILSQQVPNIEVICIDDASTDGTAALLKEMADVDGRLHVIRYAENKFAGQARKDGVAVARGRFILFCDADDQFLPGSLVHVLDEMERNPVDILHFGTQVVDCSGSLADLTWMNRHLVPFFCTLRGKSVFMACFKDELYSSALWNKMFSAEVAKKAFARFEDGLFPRGQDLYAYALLSYFAKSYRGVQGLTAYQYNLGQGKDGKRYMTAAEFKPFCSFSLSINALRRFFEAEGVFDELRLVWERIRSHLIGDCVNKWFTKLEDEAKGQCLDMMLDVWPKWLICESVARRYWNHPGCFSRILGGSSLHHVVPHRIHTIAMYYHKLVNGGVETVMQRLARYYVDMGLEVVLITDLQGMNDAITLPQGVRRVVLPNDSLSKPGMYFLRAEHIMEICRQERIDVCVYHAWNTGMLTWDMLCFKAVGVPVVVHTHSIFSVRLRQASPYFAEMAQIYANADAVVTLSDVDRCYWSRFNSNVHLVVNPPTFQINSEGFGSFSQQTVLWVARISPEKNIDDALRVFKFVHEKMPLVKFRILGTADSDREVSRVREIARHFCLEDNLEFCGFDADVRSYYRSASVLLITSDFEGFPMGAFEAKCSALPIVMYELPWLTLCKENTGTFGVNMGDYSAAANEVVRLLADEMEWKKASEAALTQAQELSGFDFQGAWTRIFQSLSEMSDAPLPDATEQLMWKVLFTHYEYGVNKIYTNGRVSGGKGGMKASGSKVSNHMLGKAGLFGRFMSKAANLSKCYIDNGLIYTLCRGLYHIRTKFDD